MTTHRSRRVAAPAKEVGRLATDPGHLPRGGWARFGGRQLHGAARRQLDGALAGLVGVLE